MGCSVNKQKDSGVHEAREVKLQKKEEEDNKENKTKN